MDNFAIFKLMKEIESLKKELDKNIKDYLKSYKDFLPKDKNRANDIILNIKKQKEEQIAEQIENLQKELKEQMGFRSEQINTKAKEIFLSINSRLILETILSSIKSNVEENSGEINKIEDFLSSDNYKCSRYVFTNENINEYFIGNNEGKVIFGDKGKELSSYLKSSVKIKFFYLFIKNKLSQEKRVDFYIVLKNNKLIKCIEVIYNNGDNFIDDITLLDEEKMKFIIAQHSFKSKEYINDNFAGDININLKKPYEDSINNTFNYSFSIECQLNNKFIRNIDTYKSINKIINIRNMNISKKDLILWLKNKKVFFSILCYFSEELNNNLIYVISEIDNNIKFFEVYSFINEYNERVYKVKNIINDKNFEFDYSTIVVDDSTNIIDDVHSNNFFNEIEEEIKTFKSSIMVVGGIWSKSSKKEVLKEYNATFISLEDYERYSEKSKNMDYIFIDTSANTHSNTYKAKSIHDNVKLISRSKKEEIDKWIK